ncbi:MAG: ATP-binding protein [Prevotellaceae bacterium]|nr:ATP-binding protein [Prevotellaceae bacterium]
MENSIIGRKKEIGEIKKYISSEQSEFIAIYGRRRVGKTFLVKELFEGGFTFRMTGKENARLGEQLLNFSYALTDFFEDSLTPKNWTEAFRQLSKNIERMGEGTKIIFIDELPWLDTPKSQFLGALEYFWNNWAYYRKDVKLIVCGSATSWMLNKLINSRGGLHNRVTHKMLIAPFCLEEMEQYFQSKGFNYERPEMIDCYMTVGGVAYYLSLFDKEKSVAENINSLCFTRGGELTDEFNRLYNSLFKKGENHIAVINALSNAGKGMTRVELIKKTKLSNNGNLTTLLKELEICEFIRSYHPFGKEKKEKMFQLTDQFSLFYFKFMKDKENYGRDYWLHKIGTPEYTAWSGYAFETVCLHHIEQIVNALGISGTFHSPCSWIYRPTEAVINDANADDDLKTGGQIDLLIDRNDKTISVCEMKYSGIEYEITKSYANRVEQRLRTFRKVTNTKKSFSLVYITPFGLHNNMYARKVNKQITADDLFKKI